MNVVITGASRGIGNALAKIFAHAGHTLFLCARKKTTLDAAVEDIKTIYPRCEVFSRVTNLAGKEEAGDFANWCLTYGIPDILINNAGNFLPGNILEEADGSLEEMMSNNLFSAYHLTRKLAPMMIKNGSGHIFNICSVAALQAYEGGGGYSISKFALDGFTKNLRYELKQHGVKVTGVFPGAVFTDSWQGFDNGTARIMEASDIAQMVYAATLLSPQAVVEDIIIRPQLGDL